MLFTKGTVGIGGHTVCNTGQAGYIKCIHSHPTQIMVLSM